MKLLISTSVLVAAFAVSLDAQRRGGQSVWAHLKETYDKNGDGKITAEEHGRGARVFKNLDRNSDGVISSADYEQRRGGRRNRGRRPAGRDRRAAIARTLGDMYGSFLNQDGKPGIDKDEWQCIVKLLRPDEKGLIDAKNFDKLTGADGKTRMARRFAGGRLARSFDLDGDGGVTTDDLAAMFKLLDVDGDGNIEQGKEIDMPPGVGEMAPDFTLPFAKNAKRTVTLSSHRGQKPVCLIFGSYT